MSTASVLAAASVLPGSVADKIENILSIAPDEQQGILRTELYDGIQEFLAKCKTQLDADNARALEETVKSITAEGRKEWDKALKELEAKYTPQSPDDIQKLVSQEYLTFKLDVMEMIDGEMEPRQRTFTIREVPQVIEKKFINVLRDDLIPLLKDLKQLKFERGSSVAEKMEQAVKSIPGALEMFTKLARIALDPFGKEKIDVEWISNNLSNYRIVMVIEAQVKAMRLRDFMSAVFRAIQTTT